MESRQFGDEHSTLKHRRWSHYLW